MINPHLRALPAPGEYARAWRRLCALPDAALVKHPDWTRGTVAAQVLRAELRRALDRRINTRGGQPAANQPIPVELIRDAHRANDIRRIRLRVYQFETARIRRRCGHLLADRDD